MKIIRYLHVNEFHETILLIVYSLGIRNNIYIIISKK